MMTTKRNLIAGALTVVLSVLLGVSQVESASKPYDSPVQLDLSFIFHIDEDLAEQDVFVERKPGSGLVYRPTKADRDMSLPLYTPAKPVEHQPFDPEATGPWPKGRALGITLGEWFAATGRGSYSCNDGQGWIRVEFERLVPNAVYTMWHDFMAWPPTEPFNGTYDLPIGARDGSESVFHSNDKGNAIVERQFKPCLQLSGEHLMADLAIAWHSDGKTYGAIPGEFSTGTHVHMYLALPKRTGI